MPRATVLTKKLINDLNKHTSRHNFRKQIEIPNPHENNKRMATAGCSLNTTASGTAILTQVNKPPCIQLREALILVLNKYRNSKDKKVCFVCYKIIEVMYIYWLL